MRLLRLALEKSDTNRHYSVYVIELSKDVMKEVKFSKRNPDYVSGKPCVYVGMTGLDPTLRFERHKNRIKHNEYVYKYGIKLISALYGKYLNLTFEDAKQKEFELAKELQDNGYAVWQA